MKMFAAILRALISVEISEMKGSMAFWPVMSVTYTFAVKRLSSRLVS